MTLAETEKAIARLLMDLEIKERCLVDDINIDRRDVTNISNRGPMYVRVVRITVSRVPGEEWHI